jgi:type IV pilus assembly protein PilC
MFASTFLPLTDLIELCRVMRHGIGAGLPLTKLFGQQATSGPEAVRPVADRVNRSLEQGESLDDVLQRESALFPPLFLSLVGVGERSGMLPEVFGELEKYFVQQLKLRRQFRSQIAWPVFELLAAILVIAILIFAVGLIAQMQRARPMDPLGLGLTGGTGALIFLFLAFGTIGGLIGLYLFAMRKLQHQARVDALLLRVPAIGSCLRALALARFCLALRLTMEAGITLRAALRLSLRATGNAAFIAATPAMIKELKAGSDLTSALTVSDLFPEDFRHMVALAEETGQLPEVMRRQATEYEDEAGRRLAALTTLAGWGVWLVVAAVIILAIFRIWGTVMALR